MPSKTTKTTKTTTFPVTIDNRGFLRWIADTARDLKIGETPFFDLFVDTKGRRIAIQPGKKLKSGSFRLLDHQGRFLTYVRGAMHAAGLEAKPGAYEIIREGKLLILAPSKTKAIGTWEAFECRNSAGVPMLSIDRRGTLILDRNCTSAIDFDKNDSCEASWDKKKKEFVLEFGKKGALSVRRVASHANISFMGTLSSNGLPLPTEKFRSECSISGKTLRFKVEPLAKL